MTSYLKLIAKAIAASGGTMSYVTGGKVADGGSYTATKDVSLPASGITDGDLLVVVSTEVMAAGDYTEVSAATSSDATALASFGTQTTPRARPEVTVFTEPLTTADHSGTVTIDFSDGGNGRSSLVWGIFRSSTGTVTVEDGPDFDENDSSAEDVQWPSMTSVADDTVFVAAVGHRDAGGLTDADLGTFTKVAVNDGAGRQSGMWYKLAASASTEAPATVSGLDEWVSTMLILKAG